MYSYVLLSLISLVSTSFSASQEERDITLQIPMPAKKKRFCERDGDQEDFSQETELESSQEEELMKLSEASRIKPPLLIRRSAYSNKS